MSPQIHPSGFRISERPVAASFAHPESFQPIGDFAIRDEACLASSIGLGGAEGMWVRYWDEGSTVAVLEFKVEMPTQQAEPATKEKKKKPKG
jgi:RNA-binding protein 5/10